LMGLLFGEQVDKLGADGCFRHIENLPNIS
jgi:hypothetical protein